MQQDLPFEKVAILGVGLLGGSVGLALRRAGFSGRIAGLGHRRTSLDAARAAGAIDQAGLAIGPVVGGAGLVVLAGPIRLFERLLADAAPHLSDMAVVTDVGSTKRQVVAWAGRLLPKAVRFVGAHPIAGSDKRGVQFARADLFDSACCVLTPRPPRGARAASGRGPQSRRVAIGDPNSRVRSPSDKSCTRELPLAARVKDYEKAVDQVDRFWRALGMWTVRMSPADHDRCLAQVSHLPHATAVALMLLGRGEAVELAGPGFMDCTRIAGGDPQLWRDIFLTNADQVVRSIKALNRKLDRLASMIGRGNGAGLVRLLADAQRRRHELVEGKLKRRQLEG